MVLTIDIGNTLTKVGLFSDDELVDVAHYKSFSASILQKKYLSKKWTIDGAIVSSVVKQHDKEVIKCLKKLKTFVLLNEKTKTPLIKKYKTPSTLGNDRLAAACGAYALFPECNTLVIDAGTAIKYDFVNESGQYLGGSISPGLRMRYQALHNFTAKLPLVQPKKSKLLIGRSTSESILTGVQKGILFEMNGFIEQYSKQYKNLKILITGGDYQFFANDFNLSIFAAPQLIHLGLHEILRCNIKG